MEKVKYLLLLVAFVSGTNLNAQDLNLQTYQWKNRIVLVVSEDGTDAVYCEQLQEFSTDEAGLKERRLLIVEVQGDKYRLVNSLEQWTLSTTLYEKYASTDGGFKVILIGLDGGVKVEQRTLLSKTNLFSTIDVMPMRKAELRTKGH